MVARPDCRRWSHFLLPVGYHLHPRAVHSRRRRRRRRLVVVGEFANKLRLTTSTLCSDLSLAVIVVAFGGRQLHSNITVNCSLSLDRPGLSGSSNAARWPQPQTRQRRIHLKQQRRRRRPLTRIVSCRLVLLVSRLVSNVDTQREFKSSFHFDFSSQSHSGGSIIQPSYSQTDYIKHQHFGFELSWSQEETRIELPSI